jgi:hypothetical protein
MPVQPAVSDLDDADFEAIEAAVMETPRGRWFLAEFARRNRHADTEVLLAAVARLERGVSDQRQHAGMERFRTDLADMSAAIADARAEISSLPDPLHSHHAGLGEASHELDAITGTIEIATTEILAATESIQDATWAMRENGVESALCDSIDEQATNIYTACSFQDLTAQRIEALDLGEIEYHPPLAVEPGNRLVQALRGDAAMA